MKFSESWLREWVDPKASSEELGERLTMAGLELDGMDAAAPALEGVVVARIDEAQPHPDADKLQVCQVNLGKDNTKQIVCGASNAREGLVTALATEGTMLPSGMKIEGAKLRGVESFGMLCSSNELGLDEESEGIIELDGSLIIGESLASALNLEDTVFDIDLTPNRSDCLCIEGVAREVSALYQLAVNVPAISTPKEVIDDQFPVEVSNPQQCPRYCGRIIKYVNANAATPIWMRERLRRAGIRCISIIVDVCNYVMLELGQPMHAFDLEKLNDKIIIRMAQAGEKLVLLDGKEVQLNKDNLIIADQKSPLAIAGIMGGEHSAVQASTTQIFLESAYFNPLAIAGKARQFGLHTESSHRFERGVDSELPMRAMKRATELITQYAGGEVAPAVEVVNDQYLPERKQISLSVRKVSSVLGIEISQAEIVAILESLACSVTVTSDDIVTVIPPSYRFDISIEVDLVEEIARMCGYDKFPTQSLPIESVSAGTNQKSDSVYLLQQDLMALGYNEAVTFSFTTFDNCGLFDQGQPKQLANPISADLSNMRTSLWPALCEAAGYNLKRQHSTIRLFEVGRKYLAKSSGLEQTDVLAGVAVGEAQPRQWAVSSRSIDFYDLKGDITQLLEKAGLEGKISFSPCQSIGLHPGKTAEILIDDKSVGILGALHPNVAKILDLSNRETLVFELKIDDILLNIPRNSFELWSKFPQVRRDLSLTLDQEIPAQDLLNAIYSLELQELQEIVIFSVYQGEGVPSGAKSVSLGLILQDFSSTLTEQQIEQIMTNIISHLADTFNAELRST